MLNITILTAFAQRKAIIVKKLNTLWEESAFYFKTALYFCYQIAVKIEQSLNPIRVYAMKLSALSLVFVISAYMLFPNMANADFEEELLYPDAELVAMIIASMKNETKPYGKLPVAKDAPSRRTYTIPITAYTSEVGQTDDTPCITASGLDVCERGIENVVAANFLPIGTRVRIPELYGDRIFYVEDRMNERYYYKMDIWMKEKAHAKHFGVRHATIEVF